MNGATNGGGVTIRPGKPFWTFVWAFAWNMVALFGVDQIDVIAKPVTINNWFVATGLSLLMALAVYAKVKVDAMNGDKHAARE